jgi:hypothetical protein
MRVALEPGIFARDEECHAALDVDGAVVESYAETADVRITRREKPLAQVREGAVGAHHVESVFGEVVVHGFVAELLADCEQLRFAVGWGAGWLRGTRVKDRQPCVWGGIAVPVLEDVGEANVVVGGAGVPADVDVAWTEEVVEDLELELSWEAQQGGFR